MIGVTLWDILMTLLPVWALQPALYLIGLWVVAVGILVPIALAKYIYVGKRDGE